MPTTQVEVLNGKWILSNGRVRAEFAAGTSGGLALTSLRNLLTGSEWVRQAAPAGVLLETADGQASGTLRLDGQCAGKCGKGGAELVFAWLCPRSGLRVRQIWRCFPGAAALECCVTLENRGAAPLPRVTRLLPFQMTVGDDAAALNLYGPDLAGRHGYYEADNVAEERAFLQNWLVLQDNRNKECLLLGGDMGALILPLRTIIRPADKGVTLIAGHELHESPAAAASGGYELAPGQSAETPIVFLALAAGGPDEVANEAHRYLKANVFPKPVANTPQAVYGVWFTDPDAEALLLEEVEFARRMGFDVLVHDASWYEGGSLVPGMNDWTLGLGSYKDCRCKFPRGLKHVSRQVHKAGLKFGLWVDPGNVDSARVASGEFPASWLGRIGGRDMQCKHPSLSLTHQLCLGNPEVVRWIKQKLAQVIEAFEVDWLKWDPSCTSSYACDRTDHGHGRHNGATAAYAGMMEILDFLKKRFPALSGYECPPSLRHCRTNPGPRTLLPGGYINEFITGPMVSPFVWGSLAAAGVGDATDRLGHAAWAWFSASALDYNLRLHLCHGMTFGTINGSSAQRLSCAPQGYLEALKRGLLLFKEYRHLLLENLFHPLLSNPLNWEAIQYVDDAASESAVFVFRHKGGPAENAIRLKGLRADAEYTVSQANLRPGRQKRLTGAALMGEGLSLVLPDAWLAKGAGVLGKDYEDQLTYGSDIVFLAAQSEEMV